MSPRVFCRRVTSLGTVVLCVSLSNRCIFFVFVLMHLFATGRAIASRRPPSGGHCSPLITHSHPIRSAWPASPLYLTVCDFSVVSVLFLSPQTLTLISPAHLSCRACPNLAPLQQERQKMYQNEGAQPSLRGGGAREPCHFFCGGSCGS